MVIVASFLVGVLSGPSILAYEGGTKAEREAFERRGYLNALRAQQAKAAVREATEREAARQEAATLRQALTRLVAGTGTPGDQALDVLP